MRAEEVWAQQVIGMSLGVDVWPHDDNSVDSMYDLRVGPADAPILAIEVVGAVDREWTETWNVGPAVRGNQWSVSGDWMITIRPGTRVKTLKRRLPPYISRLESLGLLDYDCDYGSRWRRSLGDDFGDSLEILGVDRLHCLEPKGSGRIHMTMPEQGGGVHEDGNLIADWVVDFLLDDDRADVLHKLSLIATAARREVFIAVTFMGAPWSVTSYLTGDLEHLPGASPLLPPPVDGVWLAPTLWHGEPLGVRWDGTQWNRFQLRVGDQP